MESTLATDRVGDGDLVRHALAGSKTAFGRLYDRHARLIRALCFETTRRDDQAQDLCQETFLRAYRRLGTLREPDKFAPWLISIAKHVCREWRRASRRDRHRSLGEPPAPEAAGDDAGPADDDLARLAAAVARLPERQRLALYLFYLEEQSAESTAAALGLSRATFYRQLARAKDQLRAMLGQERV